MLVFAAFKLPKETEEQILTQNMKLEQTPQVRARIQLPRLPRPEDRAAGIRCKEIIP